jgi:hypothetical protein
LEKVLKKEEEVKAERVKVKVAIDKIIIPEKDGQ